MAGEKQNRSIGIVIYPEAEVLDITGPHEVFSMAAAFSNSNQGFPIQFP